MWLLLCIFLLYWSIGVGWLSKVNRGDYDIDPYEMKRLNWASDKGFFSNELKSDFWGTLNTMMLFALFWPVGMFAVNKELREEREKLFVKVVVDR